ncbi:receptor like protein 43 [Hibiscus trionum]|uniref:Receptor like protein 43 n=1 Tax=Hibiscus trionum TaxID=183268 RepID=A0A9W7LWY8_HIBTR|nr:receptor like protein 43 [Hibiscus trionum]
MAKPGFFSPLLLLLLFAIFRATLSTNSPDIVTDQTALLALKSHISHDPHNLLATNWSSSASVCNWIGVTCGSRHHRVTALNLSSMDLTGTIPSQLGDLSFLASLDIRHNSFHGSLPAELTSLHRLKYLNFGYNNFSGEIPSWFGYFTTLQSLYLYDNNFTGVIPSTFGNLSKLETLSMHNNNLQGHLPSAIFDNFSRLQKLNLRGNQISGHLPSGIFGKLSKLQELDLSENQISGRIPNNLFNCKELKFLSLYNNLLEGSIPIEIGNLTKLQILFLHQNNLKGHLPSEIFDNLSKLQVLNLVENHISGTIPSSIFKCKELWYLSFFENSLEGSIPIEIGNLRMLEYLVLGYNNLNGCTLQTFQISNNQVEGSLPQSLVNCKDLKLLDVGNNYLNDTFPAWLGNLEQLQVLTLRWNRFHGQVGSSEVTVLFTRLRAVDISHNNFSGYLPVNFFKNLHAIREGYEKKDKPEYMTDIFANGTLNYVFGLSFTTKGLETEFEKLLTIWTAIDFSNNQFNGEIPKTLGDLHSLLVLNLSHNCLTGPIPLSLGDLSELESLDLSSNQLQGRIPTELTNLGFLEVLNLSHNDLKGPIPKGKQFDTFTNDSYIGNLGLCGLPLSKSCGNDEGTRTPARLDRDGDDDDDGINWKFSILMGYGCGLVLGLSTGYIVFTTGKPWWFIRIYERVRQRCAKR